MICLDTPEQIDGARMLVLRSGLKVELIGMRLTRGRTCYSMIKEGLHGGSSSAKPKDPSGESKAPSKAPPSTEQSQLVFERRLWVVSACPLSNHAAQTRTVGGLSATYSAEYTERGSTGKSTYDLHFADGRVTGSGWDEDGEFQVRGHSVL